MRLFRQARLGDWQSVFERMASELRRLIACDQPGVLARVAMAPGELLDKVGILEIKSERISDAPKRSLVLAELAALREAGIPDAMTYRAKWQIGLELYDHAVGNGLSFDWFTFDEGYGGKPDFLRGLAARRRRFVGEVPRSFTGWLKAPRIVTRPYHRRRRGCGRKMPRLASGSRPAARVEALLHRAELRDQPWQRWRVKDGDKGPMVWEVKHARFYAKDPNGLPGEPLRLLAARNVLNPEEVKFFISNAAPQTSVEPMLRAAFSRWRVERCFEDAKGEVGMDH
jgi:SRSO17 transposase